MGTQDRMPSSTNINLRSHTRDPCGSTKQNCPSPSAHLWYTLWIVSAMSCLLVATSTNHVTGLRICRLDIISTCVKSFDLATIWALFFSGIETILAEACTVSVACRKVTSQDEVLADSARDVPILVWPQ